MKEEVRSPERCTAGVSTPCSSPFARQSNSPVVGLVLRYRARGTGRALCPFVVEVSSESIPTCKDMDMARWLAEAVRRDDRVDPLASQCAAGQDEERLYS